MRDIHIYMNSISLCFRVVSVFLYLYGCVPFPVLRGLPVVRFLRFGLKGLVLLIGHFDHGVLGFLQLGALFGRPLPPPAYLRSTNTAVMPVRNAFQNPLTCSLLALPFINHWTGDLVYHGISMINAWRRSILKDSAGRVNHSLRA